MRLFYWDYRLNKLYKVPALDNLMQPLLGYRHDWHQQKSRDILGYF